MYGKLNVYLADIDEQAQEMFSRLVKQMAEREGRDGTVKSGKWLRVDEANE